MKIFTITMAPINPPYDDGAKNMVMGVARRIKEHYFYFVSSLGRKFKKNDNIIFVQSPFQKQGKHSMSFMQKLYIFLITILMAKKLDIFQFFFTPQPYFSVFYKKFVRKNNKRSVQIVTSIHTLFDKNKEDIAPSLFFADRVVVHSDYARQRLLDLGVKNAVRVYPGVETERFKPVHSGEAARSQNIVKIIYPGTYKILNDSYSFEDFLKITTGVTEKIPNIEFIMACRVRTREDAILKNKFVSLLKQRGFKNFALLDTVDDIPALFNSCAAGIMPANRPMVGILEIPLVLLELAALKKPVIYGDVPPLDELERKGIGIKITGPAPEAYVKSLIRCLEDKKFSSEVGRRSYDAVTRDFTMDTIAAQYRNIYSDIQRTVHS